MRQAGFGRIVNRSSVLGLVGLPYRLGSLRNGGTSPDAAADPFWFKYPLSSKCLSAQEVGSNP